MQTTLETVLKMRSTRHALLVALGIFLVLTSVASMSFGALELSFKETFFIILSQLGVDLNVPINASHEAVVCNIRLPRIVLGVLVGGTLAVSGSLMQGIFRNPLAEASLIGVSSGAALAAAFTIVLGGRFIAQLPDGLQPFTLPITAFFGACLSTYLVYLLSLKDGRVSITTMLLAGIAMNAITFSVLGVLQYLADDNALRSLTFWMMGSLGGATWETVSVIAVFLLIPFIGSLYLAGPLNCFSLGSTEAMHLGISVHQVTRFTVCIVALAVGATVASSGMIGFIGLIVPHLIRLGVSPDHRLVIPGSALLGASLLVAADTFARLIVMPAELPVGIVTTLLGSPFFLFLLLRAKQ